MTDEEDFSVNWASIEIPFSYKSWTLQWIELRNRLSHVTLSLIIPFNSVSCSYCAFNFFSYHTAVIYWDVLCVHSTRGGKIIRDRESLNLFDFKNFFHLKKFQFYSVFFFDIRDCVRRMRSRGCKLPLKY